MNSTVLNPPTAAKTPETDERENNTTMNGAVDLVDRIASVEATMTKRFEIMREVFANFRSEVRSSIDAVQQVNSRCIDSGRSRLIEFLGYEPTPQQQLELFVAYAAWHGTAPTLQVNRKADFRSKEGNRVNYEYADLAAVISVAQTAAHHGLSAFTRQELDDKGHSIVTAYLVHSSGGAIASGPLPLFTVNSSRPGQDHAKALTTCRRLALQIVLGLAAERDDDFNNSDETSPVADRESRPAPPRTTATPPRRLPNSAPDNSPRLRQGPPPGWLSREDRQRLERELADPNITPARFQEIETRLTAANQVNGNTTTSVTQ